MQCIERDNRHNERRRGWSPTVDYVTSVFRHTHSHPNCRKMHELAYTIELMLISLYTITPAFYYQDTESSKHYTVKSDIMTVKP